MKKNREMYRNFIFLTFGFYCFICTIMVPSGNLLLRKNVGNWGDIFSLGQFLTDICLIPFAIFAFYYTLHEFRKSQELADLSIGWEESNKTQYTYVIKRSELATYQTKNIYLENKGTSPSTLYQVTLEIPKECGRVQMVNSIAPWTGSIQEEHHKFNITSVPHLASFPKGPQIDLGKIAFLEPANLPSEISINYYIASEKSEYKSGKLLIHLKEKDKDEN